MRNEGCFDEICWVTNVIQNQGSLILQMNYHDIMKSQSSEEELTHTHFGIFCCYY